MNSLSVCVFGEVLYDHFPDGSRVLGGAPFNLAWHLQAFGLHPYVISRVGSDDAGKDIRAAMRRWGMDTRFLQTDQTRPTGMVNIVLENGEPHYDIVADCAYDYISETRMEAEQSRVLYHGSLALRNQTSAQTFERLSAKQQGIIFLDVNLRTPWWQREKVLSWMDNADWVKVNEKELKTLYAEKEPLETLAPKVRERHGLKGLIVTSGAHGALAVTEASKPVRVAPQRSLKVVDTVGSGDAFAAVLVLGIVKGWPLAKTMIRAQSFASRLVACRGATVQNLAFYRSSTQQWRMKDGPSEKSV
ncbi:MAG: carbohydrate kinase [Nitrospiria bacterium]